MVGGSNQVNVAQCRGFLTRAVTDVAVVGLLCAYHAHASGVVDFGTYVSSVAHGEGDTEGHASEGQGGDLSDEAIAHHIDEILEQEETEANALLFPWFAEMMGVAVYYVLTRHAHAVPYTAVMFLVGAFIGVALDHELWTNALTRSAATWVGIEGEVLLLVFLPGLLYLDSYNIDVRLFLQSFWQLVAFAFPMVLGGTCLTALVAMYVFPYGWSFDLSMTFGAILAATDPVAVAVLLNELGAPPRLKIHISGESLMNDGSAVVFYNIFSVRFLYLMGLPGVGEAIDWGQGFALFFRLAFGGMCIGLAFGVGLLLVLYRLDRRLSGEDAVVQVVATITTAYLTFFTSEILSGCSGIIAVLFCGVTVKAAGENLYSDPHLSLHFWEITEYLLNTLLFTLAGCLWGDIISVREHGQLFFTGADWGYLVALFILITIIRFFLVFAFYPLTSSIGIGTNWREAVFMSYGGLRGAVGIALSMSLHAKVQHFTEAGHIDEVFHFQAAKLFAMVGGIALLTLVVNGPTAGPLLKKLGLVTPTETREKIMKNYRQHMVQNSLLDYVALLADPRFRDVEFAVVQDNIPWYKDVTYEQLISAVKKHAERTPPWEYEKPILNNALCYLYDPWEAGNEDEPTLSQTSSHASSSRRKESLKSIRHAGTRRQSVFDMDFAFEESIVQEERLVFIKLLRASYHRLIEHGELDSHGLIAQSLFNALDTAEDSASKGHPLNDWHALLPATEHFARPLQSLLRGFFNLKQRLKRREVRQFLDLEFFDVHVKVRQILAFKRAHAWARKIFKEEFSKAGKEELTGAEKIVLDECDLQVGMANNALQELPPEDVIVVESLYVCQILLNKSAHYTKKLNRRGLMTEREAGEICEEIEELISNVLQCRQIHQMKPDMKQQRLSQMPDHLQEYVGHIPELPRQRSRLYLENLQQSEAKTERTVEDVFYDPDNVP